MNTLAHIKGKRWSRTHNEITGPNNYCSIFMETNLVLPLLCFGIIRQTTIRSLFVSMMCVYYMSVLLTTHNIIHNAIVFYWMLLLSTSMQGEWPNVWFFFSFNIETGIATLDIYFAFSQEIYLSNRKVTLLQRNVFNFNARNDLLWSHYVLGW